jgi:DNA-binding transcriptional MerR regulator
MAHGREYTVAQLAEATGMSVRNLRAYRSRGLLSAPRMRGRVGYYGTEHLTQLRLVQALLERGLSLAVIARLVERGGAQSELARLVRDELGVTANHFPVVMSPQVVFDLERAQPGIVGEMARLGLGRRRGLGYVGDPGLFALANALVGQDVPTPAAGQVCLVAARAAGEVVTLVDADPDLRATTTDPARHEALLVLVELATTAFRTALTTRLGELEFGPVSAPGR